MSVQSLQRQRRTLRLTAVALALAGVASVLLAASPAAHAASASYTFRSFLKAGTANLCLDADANTGVGAHVNTVTCNNSNYQRWSPAGAGSQIIWENVGHPGLVLATTSLANGGSMVLKRASSTDRTEWFEYFGTDSGGYKFANPPTKLSLDSVFQTGVPQNGRQVRLSTPKDVSNQSWYETRVS